MKSDMLASSSPGSHRRGGEETPKNAGREVRLKARERSEGVVIAYLAALGMMLAVGIDIALPAFDAISTDLSLDRSPTLIVTSYLIGMAAGQLIWGPISDRYGRRNAVFCGLVIFALGAAGSALAPNFATLLGARFFWGIGAAAPAGLRAAYARDLYEGDKMARVVSIMMAVFLIGPVFVPLLADGLVQRFHWTILFWISSALAVLGALMSLWFGETLPLERRSALSFRRFGQALGVIAKTRVTLGMIIANIMFSGAFFIFLGSTQPVVSRIYNRPELFAKVFALNGAVAIVPLLVNNKLIGRFGAGRMALVWVMVSQLFVVFGLVHSWAYDGHPPFWAWLVWLAATTTVMTLSNPSFSALALEPMGKMAGTVASIFYGAGFAGGAFLAAIFESQIRDSVTQFNLGFAIYVTLSTAAFWWSGAGRKQTQP